MRQVTYVIPLDKHMRNVASVVKSLQNKLIDDGFDESEISTSKDTTILLGQSISVSGTKGEKDGVS